MAKILWHPMHIYWLRRGYKVSFYKDDDGNDIVFDSGVFESELILHTEREEK